MERDWKQAAEHASARHDDGRARLPDEPDERQRQLTRMGNAAWAAGLSYLMTGRDEDAGEWLRRAAERYRASWTGAPPGSWGRPIGAMKARLLADDVDGARADARWALDAGAATAESPVGSYAAALAHLVVGDDSAASVLAASLRGRDDFPQPVGDALLALASRDRRSYEKAVRALLQDFEERTEFLEDVRVADTVLALQRLAHERGLEVALSSPLLPAEPA